MKSLGFLKVRGTNSRLGYWLKNLPRVFAGSTLATPVPALPSVQNTGCPVTAKCCAHASRSAAEIMSERFSTRSRCFVPHHCATWGWSVETGIRASRTCPTGRNPRLRTPGLRLRGNTGGTLGEYSVNPYEKAAIGEGVLVRVFWEGDFSKYKISEYA